MDYIAKMAKLLRTTEEVILNLEKKMEKVSGKRGVIEKIVQENEEKVEEKITELFPERRWLKATQAGNKLTAEEIYQALIEKAKHNDQALFKLFRQPEFATTAGCRVLINSIYELTGPLEGFYLKKEKAIELLKLNPPKNIMAVLGYGNDIEKMLRQEDPFEIFCALRFAEDSQWLNDVFFKPYRNLTKEDFEERKIEVRVLPEKWSGISQRFLGQKLHHMSHLKELGVVFIIPVARRDLGETLYRLFMILHYLYEVDWHSRLFKIYALRSSSCNNFGQKMIEALRVKVTSRPLPNQKRMAWRIIPKYLAKHHPNDQRLFEPHLSSEAMFYTHTYSAIQKLAARFPELELNFWQDLDFVGEFFYSHELDKELLVSFDLIDNGISLLKQSDIKSKYFYHQPEALWNKIFVEYMGQQALEKLIMENFDRGYISLMAENSKH